MSVSVPGVALSIYILPLYILLCPNALEWCRYAYVNLLRARSTGCLPLPNSLLSLLGTLILPLSKQEGHGLPQRGRRGDRENGDKLRPTHPRLDPIEVEGRGVIRRSRNRPQGGVRKDKNKRKHENIEKMWATKQDRYDNNQRNGSLNHSPLLLGISYQGKNPATFFFFFFFFFSSSSPPALCFAPSFPRRYLHAEPVPCRQRERAAPARQRTS